MPIGVNKLCRFVKEITSQAGLDGFFTNHSLRSTAAMRLYQGGVEEQVITEITGHHLLAVQGYKRTHESQKCRASQILQGEPQKCARVDNWTRTLERNAMTGIMKCNHWNNVKWFVMNLVALKCGQKIIYLLKKLFVVWLVADNSQQDQRKIELFTPLCGVMWGYHQMWLLECSTTERCVVLGRDCVLCDHNVHNELLVARMNYAACLVKRADQNRKKSLNQRVVALDSVRLFTARTSEMLWSHHTKHWSVVRMITNTLWKFISSCCLQKLIKFPLTSSDLSQLLCKTNTRQGVLQSVSFLQQQQQTISSQVEFALCTSFPGVLLWTYVMNKKAQIHCIWSWLVVYVVGI